MQLFDSLTNFVSGLNLAGKDKTAHDQFVFRPLTEPEIDAMADGDWVGKKIVEAPADDMMRAWRTWAASARAVTAFEDAEARHAVQAKVHQAIVMARRYGGSAILIGADTENPGEPLRLDAIPRGGLKYLTVLSHRDLTPGPTDTDPESPSYNSPSFYTLNRKTAGTLTLHPSRVVVFTGARRHDASAATSAWGYSVLQAPYDAIHHAALAAGAGASLLHEAKTDIVQMENLGSVLSTDEGTQALTKRWSAASLLKSLNRVLLLDTNDKWQRSQTNFSGVEGMLQRYFHIVAGAADIPAARFLGLSASGLNSSGDADIRNYYDRLQSDRVRDLQPRLARIDAALWRDATGRAKPVDATFAWDALWQPTDKERADTSKVVVDAAKSLADSALLPDDVLAQALVSRLIDDRFFPALETVWNAAQTDDPAGGDGSSEEPPPKASRAAPRPRKRRR